IRHARVGHCQAPNTRNPAHRAGFFITSNSANRLIIDLLYPLFNLNTLSSLSVLLIEIDPNGVKWRFI
ncbi:hypothetical protein ACK33N_17710, partial [Aeromonas veronii]|uniref:hypothetical protein n=1 Tax=Aeromonas veronii TaxID=654 RepID=UPI003A422C95